MKRHSASFGGEEDTLANKKRMDSEADLDITPLDIARAACVTVRAIQLAFRRHLDTTPMAHLRSLRLERAHQQLRAANRGDGTTVTDVASRWGFLDPSRFAALYRRTYGEPPSQTLQSSPAPV